MATVLLGVPSGITANLWPFHPERRLLKRHNEQDVLCAVVRALHTGAGRSWLPTSAEGRDGKGFICGVGCPCDPKGLSASISVAS